MDIDIAGKKIGINQPTFIIAELSANHNQQLDLALATVKAAKEAGADAIKLQTYTADTLTLDCDSDYFKVNHGTLWDGETLYSLYKKAYTPWEWHPEIMAYAKQLGLICFSSPFDFTAVDFLADLGVPAYKIASAEITDIPLIDYVARQQKPVIISTGIAQLADIELAVETCRKAGNNDIIVLKCTSAYPTSLDEVDLNTIANIRQTFCCEVGLSDHTLGTTVVAAAVALGARVIEKHFILDKTLGGPDADFSLDPQEFAVLVKTIRDTEKALGRINYSLSPKLEKLRQFSRSLFITADVYEGTIISLDNIRSVRPGFGLHPKYLPRVLGKTFRGAYTKGTPLSWDKIAEDVAD